MGSDVSVRSGAAEQLPVHVRAAGRAAAGALLGAEVLDEPSEAEDLDGERAEHHEKQRKSGPPVVAVEVIVGRKPNICAHISDIHSHCGDDPQTVPNRVFLLLPAEAQARRIGATATRLPVDEVRLSGSRIRLRSRSEPLNRTRVVGILQRRECYIALLHLQHPVGFSGHCSSFVLSAFASLFVSSPRLLYSRRRDTGLGDLLFRQLQRRLLITKQHFLSAAGTNHMLSRGSYIKL